jgi:hypothetical protein
VVGVPSKLRVEARHCRNSPRCCWFCQCVRYSTCHRAFSKEAEVLAGYFRLRVEGQHMCCRAAACTAGSISRCGDVWVGRPPPRRLCNVFQATCLLLHMSARGPAVLTACQHASTVDMLAHGPAVQQPVVWSSFQSVAGCCQTMELVDEVGAKYSRNFHTHTGRGTEFVVNWFRTTTWALVATSASCQQQWLQHYILSLVSQVLLNLSVLSSCCSLAVLPVLLLPVGHPAHQIAVAAVALPCPVC